MYNINIVVTIQNPIRKIAQSALLLAYNQITALQFWLNYCNNMEVFNLWIFQL